MQTWPGLCVPGRDAAVGVGEGCEWSGETEGFEQGEGDVEVDCGVAGGGVEDVACYWVFLWGCRGGSEGEDRLHLWWGSGGW